VVDDETETGILSQVVRGSLTLVRLDGVVDADVRDPAGAPPPASAAAVQRVRIVDGLLACIAAQGLSKTTLDDVARASGCSRATLYRAFPGGKEALLTATVETEVSRLFSDLAVRMGRAASLEDVLVAGMTGAAVTITGHGALAFLLEHEPEVVLPHLAFDHHDRLLAVVRQYGAPFLGRWLDHDEAERVAEWAARITLSYLGCPAADVDLTDADDVRRLVRTYVLPGISVLSTPPGEGTVVTGEDRHHPISKQTVSQSEGEAS
jgi:AcrR family transcriptional regulator